MRKFGIFWICLSLWAFDLSAQANRVEFGKNRVQFNTLNEDWSRYESEHFSIYWQNTARNVGAAVALSAEHELPEIQKILEYRINKPIEIIVFGDVATVQQSNMGLEETFVPLRSNGFSYGDKIFVYFDGDHQHLQQQIRAGLTEILLNYIFYGVTLQEILQNSMNGSLPPWYTKGLIQYLGYGWNHEIDNQWRDILAKHPNWKFQKFVDRYPDIAGAAFWQHIQTKYGSTNLSSLFYLARINRNIETSFQYVLGSPLNKIGSQVIEQDRARFESEKDQTDQLPEPPFRMPRKGKIPISNISNSPDGKTIAFTTNDVGRLVVWLQIGKVKPKKLLATGFRNNELPTDRNLPLIAWRPDGAVLTVCYPSKGKIKLLHYDLATKKKTKDELTSEYRGIIDMCYDDQNRLLLTGIQNGFSDVFAFNTTTRTSTRLHGDALDDLKQTKLKMVNRVGYLAISRRQDEAYNTILKLDSIYPNAPAQLYVSFPKGPGQTLARLTQSAYDVTNPVQINPNQFAFISADNGYAQAQIGELDSFIAYYDQYVYLSNKKVVFITYVDTVYIPESDTITIDSILREPIWHWKLKSYPASFYGTDLLHITPQGPDSLLGVVYNKGRYRFVSFSNKPKQGKISPTTATIQNGPKTKPAIEITQLVSEPKPYDFRSPFEAEEDSIKRQLQLKDQEIIQTTVAIAKNKYGIKSPHAFRQSGVIAYSPAFRINFLRTEFDNAPLVTALRPFGIDPNKGSWQPSGILVRGQVEELLENYLIEGGIRLFTGFNGTETFLQFENRLKRWDRRFGIYRLGQINREGTNIPIYKERQSTAMAYTEWRYPFSHFARVSLQGAVREDRKTQLATDKRTLNQQDLPLQQVSLRAEYVFDNTILIEANLPNGIRAKAFAETLIPFQIGPGADSAKRSIIQLIGFDARAYQRFHRYGIFAFRLAGATTLGRQKINYMLGGPDNPLVPSFSSGSNILNQPEYIYRQSATPLRGHKANVRDGSSYAVLNSEIRIHPLPMITGRRIKSNFWRNIQLVAFADIGAAWIGESPFSSDNPANTILLPENPSPANPVSLEVTYFRNPLVAGYGAGIHGMILGYFVRVDRATGLDGDILRKPIWHLSLGHDF
jgi:WD40 repeat protein